ncbi:hypothetical protein PVAP13_3KG244300 [Panicum virgatum]|uniref:MADS-box domain-containing protein n=1 Tax=Panicum virgatum TaxID=38727 RepID=A0A8T0V679_PANVG|nr:hypothetical protein PVAP13_3KG244300 [Panicum virgatum]
MVAPPRGTGRKSQGRRKRTEMALIKDRASRLVTFSKRKSGFFKKASELSLLCGAHVAAVIFSSAGRPFAFGTPSVDHVLRLCAPLPAGDEDGLGSGLFPDDATDGGERGAVEGGGRGARGRRGDADGRRRREGAPGRRESVVLVGGGRGGARGGGAAGVRQGAPPAQGQCATPRREAAAGPCLAADDAAAVEPPQDAFLTDVHCSSSLGFSAIGLDGIEEY